MKEVGYPTIFSASATALLQLEGAELENRLRVLRPRLDRAMRDSRDHVAGNIFSLTLMYLVVRQLHKVQFSYLPPSLSCIA